MARKSLYRKRMAMRGFTLAEVLVTLSIIAIMAAVLLPALNSQIAKGDAGRVASDLTNIQTGAQAFVSDVHRYPATLTHLTTAISGSMTDLLGQSYPSGLVTKWKGPYVHKEAVSPSSVGNFQGNFASVAGANAVPYLAVTLLNVVAKDFARIEDLLDEGASSTVSSTTGLVRWVASGTTGTLTYLALPVQ